MSKFKVGDRVRFNQKTIDLARDDIWNSFLMKRPSFNKSMKRIVLERRTHTIKKDTGYEEYLFNDTSGWVWASRWFEKVNNVYNYKGEEYFKNPKLSELYTFIFKEEPKNLHNSFVDVLLCLRCYFAIIENRDIIINNDIKKLFLEYKI